MRLLVGVNIVGKMAFVTLIILSSIGAAFVILGIFQYIDKKRDARILKSQIKQKHFIIDIANEVEARNKGCDCMELRTVQVFKDCEWIKVDFSELKLGDVFRMFEPTGELVVGDKGMDKWKVSSRPCLTNKKGVMAVEIEGSLE